MSNPRKKARTAISYSDKIEVIKQGESGMKLVDIAEKLKLNVSDSTISKILSRKVDIMKKSEKMSTGDMKRARFQGSAFPVLDAVLFEWYESVKEYSTVSKDVLKAKAKVLADSLIINAQNKEAPEIKKQSLLQVIYLFKAGRSVTIYLRLDCMENLHP